MMNSTKFLEMVAGEYEGSNDLYPQFHSNHEGYGVILEELDELWDEIKADKGVVPTDRMIEEAIQVAAMCLKFCVRQC